MHVMNLSTNQSLHSPCRYQSVNFLFCLVPNKLFNAFNFAFAKRVVLLTGKNRLATKLFFSVGRLGFVVVLMKLRVISWET